LHHCPGTLALKAQCPSELVALVLAIQIPFSKYVLYIDKSLDEHIVGLENFFQNVYGVDLKKSRRVTIHNTSSGKAQHLDIAGVLTYEVQRNAPS
jgi:hypothetical protein